MQVSVENTGGLARRLTVQIPSEEVHSKIETRLRELCKQVRIKGFRPGKVPLSVVKQRYGKQVHQEILNDSVQTNLQQAIESESLRPAAVPRLDSQPEEKDGTIEFSAVMEIFPQIEQVDVASLEIARPEAEVTDDDIDEMLLTLRKQRMSWTEVERKAEEGDQVLVEYVATVDDLRVPEEGNERLAIIMGTSGFDKLEAAIAKQDQGQTKKVKLTFPDNFRVPALSNQKAQVELTVTAVREGEMPEVDEEFVSSFGVEGGDVEKLRTEIKANLERELTEAKNSILKMTLTNSLIDSMPDLEVPESIVMEEAASLAAQAAQAQGVEPNPSQLEPLVEPARRRVRGGLLMGELAQQNGIRIDGGRVRRKIDTIAETYEQPAEVVQMYYNNQRLLQQVESSVLEEQVVDWVLQNANVTVREMAFQDVINEAAGRAAD
jgi:trigger factor